MYYESKDVPGYLDALPSDRRPVIEKLRQVILSNIPEGFEEQMAYGMIGYVVPLSIYPDGYHCKKGEPLPFLSLASQKNHIALYHMGLYSDPDVEAWFVEAYKNQVPTKLDMGKSCIRFRKPEQIPYELIGELCSKISVDRYIKLYESAIRK